MTRHFAYAAQVFGAALMAAQLAGSPARADYASDNKMCFTTDSSKATEKVAACTRLINSGRLRGKELASPYQDRAEGYRVLNKLDAALADFNRAIELDPQSPVPYVNRSEVHRLKGDYDGVIADTSRAMGIDPMFTAAYAIRGMAYQEKGDLVRARADYNKALAIPAKRNDGEWAQGIARTRLKALDEKK